ncbi:MAG: hypothetical protein CL785_00325 [Chloroflexi bacterium]|nr:hypothetical protein [Chloroflexota bacterium]|tara:strand:+ start:3697 stop:4347 length:651 start_codon:yes stop_codon:yes gene_type:complete
MGTISTTKLAGLSIIFGPIICLAAYFYQQLVIFADVEWAVAASWASLAAENSTAVAITAIIIPIGIFMLVHGLQFVANEIRANGNGAALAAYSVPLIMFGWIGISLSCGIYIAGANFPEPATQAAAAFLAATGILNIVGVLQSLGFLFIFLAMSSRDDYNSMFAKVAALVAIVAFVVNIIGLLNPDSAQTISQIVGVTYLIHTIYAIYIGRLLLNR